MAHILLIDDDEAFRTLLYEMLIGVGHTVASATNGLDALKLFRACPADLILTDIKMPYDGLATIRILRAEHPKLGIIAMSGGSEVRLDYARSLGAQRTLTKPFTTEELTAAIAEVLALPGDMSAAS